VPAARAWRRLARPAAEGTRWARRPDPPRFNAAKEGGFMGFGAAQVSKGEKEMLDQVRAAVSQA
jgi:hypothetical protein